MKVVVVTGSRDWDDEELVEWALGALAKWAGGPWKLCVVAGGARGADTQVEEACHRLGIHCAVVRWLPEHYKKAAGPMRNGVMLKLADPDLVLALHENLEQSRGTRNCVQQALKLQIPVRCCDGRRRLRPVRGA